MPPTNSNEFLSLLELSKLLDSDTVKGALHKIEASGGVPSTASELAERLFEEKLLTRFQIEQLLAGRHKGFFVGRYKILGLIGLGGMGRVYLGEHSIMRRQVAIKVLPKAKGSDPAALARFQREARAVASMHHPNIVHAYDMDQEGDIHYMVMEFVDGMSVQEYVRKYGPIPYRQAVDYIDQAADALEHAFAAGIVHRDIKPGNLLIDVNATIKLLDLGLAVFYEERDRDPLTLAYEENVLGTADYLAPEQALDSHNVDIRADLYSLGGTLYYMLTGAPPFPEGTIAQKLLAHQNKDPRPIREQAPDAPAELERVIAKMMAKRPDDRFQTPTELREAIVGMKERAQRPFGDEGPPSPLSWAGTAQQHSSKPSKPDAKGEGGASPKVAATGPTRASTPAPQPAPRSKNAPIPSRPPSRPTVERPANAPAAAKGTPSAPTAPNPANKRGPSIPKIPTAPSSNRPAAGSRANSTTATVQEPVDQADFLRALADSVTGGSTVKVVPVVPPKAAKPEPPAARNRPKLSARTFLEEHRRTLGIAAGAILALCITAFSLSRGNRPRAIPAGAVAVTPPASSNNPSNTLLVTAGGRYPSVADAMYEAEPGQSVTIEPNPSGAWESSCLRISPAQIDNKSRLTLTGIGPNVVLKLAANLDGPIIVIDRTREFTLRNLTLDGGGREGPLLEISGPGVAGVVVENVTLRNFRGQGIRLDGADGQTAMPVVLRGLTLRCGPNQSSGIVFAPSPTKRSRNIEIVDCVFEGPFAAAIDVSQRTSPLNIVGSRFYQGEVGVALAAGDPADRQVVIRQNTFERVAKAIRSGEADRNERDSRERDNRVLNPGSPVGLSTAPPRQ